MFSENINDMGKLFNKKQMIQNDDSFCSTENSEKVNISFMFCIARYFNFQNCLQWAFVLLPEFYVFVDLDIDIIFPGCIFFK